jgi:hypothetical protein
MEFYVIVTMELSVKPWNTESTSVNHPSMKCVGSSPTYVRVARVPHDTTYYSVGE